MGLAWAWYGPGVGLVWTLTCLKASSNSLLEQDKLLGDHSLLAAVIFDWYFARF